MLPNPGSNPLFKFEGQSVRVVMIEDKPWFVAVDVCRCLYSNYDPSQGVTRYIKCLADDEKIRATRQNALGIFEGTHGCGCILLLSESGLYKLIMRAQPNRHPAVARFQDWVTREVLPALRKDGGYIMALPTDTPEDIAIRALKASSEAIERLQKMVAERDAKISVLGVEKKDAVNRHKAA